MEYKPTQFPKQASDEWVVYRVTPGNPVAKRKLMLKGMPEDVTPQLRRYLDRIPMQFLPEFWVGIPDGTFVEAIAFDLEGVTSYG